jgi:hypothetical protein
VALALAVSFCAVGSLGAVVLDAENTTRLRERALPGERSWVDGAGLEDVALLQTSAIPGDTYVQLFWNRSVTSLLMLPGIAAPDAYHVERVSVADDGRLLSRGRPVRRPLLVDEYAARIELTGAVAVAAAPAYRLWRPAGTPRLQFIAHGYLESGWLGRAGRFRVWPSTPSGELAGQVSFRAIPSTATVLAVRTPNGRRLYRLEPGKPTTIVIPVCGRGPWTATFESSESHWDGARFVSTRASRPVWATRHFPAGAGKC